MCTGIGRVIMDRLLRLGSHVIAVSNERDKLPPDGPKLTSVCVDIGHWYSVYDKILNVGPVHGLVNNAGVAHIESFLNLTQHSWDE